MAVDCQNLMLKNLENHLADQLEHIRSNLEAHGYDGLSDIEANIMATETQYIAVFPKYQIGLPLMSKSKHMIPGFEKRYYIEDNIIS